ncbi:MAG: ComEC/Rec2 family competence protein [Thermomicrobiales bacterium]
MVSPVGLMLGSAISVGIVFGFAGAAALIILVAGTKLAGFPLRVWTVIAICLCLLIGAIRQTSLDAPTSIDQLASSDRAIATIESIPVARPGGDRVIVRVTEVRQDDTWHHVDAHVVAYIADSEEITVGDTIEAVWSFSSVDTLSPGFGSYVTGQGAVGSASIFSVQVTHASTSPRRFLVSLRRSVSDRILDLVPGDAGALMSGIVTGDDSALSAERRDDFNRTSTAHITAVSGSNVAMLLALWTRLVPARSRRNRLLIQAGIIASIWMYCIATGLEASALRASAVATMVVLSSRFGRRSDAMTALAIATAVLLLFDPDLRGSLGFWLSVSASTALAGSFNEDVDGSGRSLLFSSIRGLVAAQFATMPIIVWAFGTISVTGLIANLLVSPVLILAFPLTFVFAALAFVPVVGPIAGVVPAIVSDVILTIVSRLAPVSPPVSLAANGKQAAFLIAIPCACVVLWLNQDVQRWLPRFASIAPARQQAVIGGAFGLILGTALAAALMSGFSWL